MRVLLSHGANKNLRGGYNETPLGVAYGILERKETKGKIQDYEEVCHVLVEAPDNTNQRQQSDNFNE